MIAKRTEGVTARRSYRVEWYIAGLIVFEIVFSFIKLALEA
jgi:uncharacterized Rmd1/YagE family protein